MMNLSYKLNRLEERLSKRPPIDPEVAIHRICKYIDLGCSKNEIAENEKVTYFDFVWMINHSLSHDEGQCREQRAELWKEIENAIRSRNGFKPDAKDEEAIKIKEF